MQVDEPWSDDTTGKVEDRAVRCRGIASQYVGHAFAVEDEGDVWSNLAGNDVGEPAAPSSHERVSCYESSHGLSLPQQGCPRPPVVTIFGRSGCRDFGSR